MKFTRLSILSVLLLGASFAIDASIKDLPVREVNGQTYHYYEVASKETVYSVCHRFGISKEELIKYNPAVADGLKAGMELLFPADSDKKATSSTSALSSPQQRYNNVVHHVEKGQTIYGIAAQYGISTESLIEQNPIINDGLKAGQTLHISTPADGGATKPSGSNVASHSNATSSNASTGYIVKKKETFYSISKAHGITVAELEAANPGITVLREGQVLSIPTAQTATATASATSTTVENQSVATTVATNTEAQTPTISVDDFAAASGIVQDKDLSVAVVLPFMLNEETMSKSAQRYTEFYKGLLLAADSLRNNGTPIRISAFDTEGSVAKFNEILADPTLKNHRLIIAPDNVEQLIMLGEFGRANGVKVLNSFIVRDETFKTNPTVMQANIPSDMMIEKAVDALTLHIGKTTPVFLTVADGANDKAEFVEALKKNLKAKGIDYKIINAPEGYITKANLQELPAEGNYTFIPATGRQSEVNKLLPGIIEWRDEAIMPVVKVIGYPEWITFRGETLDKMYNLNTIVYSRFFDDESAPRSKDVAAKFKKWYGSDMENAIPRQGMLGFDTGIFVFNYLKNSVRRYDGVQNGFNFTETSDNTLGECNSMLYIINYRPGGVVEKINL